MPEQKPFVVILENGSTSVGLSSSLTPGSNAAVWYFNTIEEAETFAEFVQTEYL